MPTRPIAIKKTAQLPSLRGEQSLTRIEMLFDIVRSLNSIFQLDILLNQIVASAAEMLEAKGGALLLLDGESGELKFEVTSGRAASVLKGATLPVDDRSVEGTVALRGTPCTEEDIQARGYPFGQASRQSGAKNVICVPLKGQDRVVGVLEVMDKISGNNFDKDDVKLLEALADAALVAIENVRLYEEQQRQARALAQAYNDLHKTYQATLQALTGMLDARDVATHGHSIRVVAFTLKLALTMGVTNPTQLRIIEQGALLHDVGKIGVDDGILRKPGPLSEEDWEQMRSHPELGYKMLKEIEFLHHALPIVRHHHEHWDGTGYPMGLKGEDIPFEARIFSVADAFDAITSERPYSRARTYEEAAAILVRERGINFDPQVIEAFMQVPKEEWDRIRESAD